ncbi:TetR/AcrR family transcriptional regulator [Clostridium sp. MCC353]|uniref:TetR/AcrR family transcriptional regulator n=1 Tax=Clostridium sp. MCC353 TaxID=2592646 RepID=UPI002079414D|nr:TetR/AcrR family transcriptional regulator [Clostridium sp. MCC353]
MKREEKNLISLQKILEYATQEFAQRGYGLSSVNTICNTGGISKGILYHYFKDKDELYLSCLKTCFERLTAFLREEATDIQGSVDECLERYFNARLIFLRKILSYAPCFVRQLLRRLSI